MSFPAVLDTNVLYGALLSDYLLWLADRKLFRPLWSEQILEELERNLIENGEVPELVHKRLHTMRDYFPDALVTGHESLIDRMECHPKDRHVLAAAVRANAEVLVTFNLKDFPVECAAPFDIQVLHPDDFMLDQLDLYPGATVRTLYKLSETYDSPTMTVDDIVLSLARDLPQFADAVRPLLDATDD